MYHAEMLSLYLMYRSVCPCTMTLHDHKKGIHWHNRHLHNFGWILHRSVNPFIATVRDHKKGIHWHKGYLHNFGLRSGNLYHGHVLESNSGGP